MAGILNATPTRQLLPSEFPPRLLDKRRLPHKPLPIQAQRLSPIMLTKAERIGPRRTPQPESLTPDIDGTERHDRMVEVPLHSNP